MIREWLREPYSISTAPEQLDLDVIHAFISSSYWAAGRSRERVERSIAHSLAFGLYHRQSDRLAQVGFARVITDYSTFAYLADVFVLESHRGRGLGVWLVETLLGVPELAGVRWMLGTRDAHELYRKFEFQETPAGLIMRRNGLEQGRS